jgi:ribonuclease P protein component
VARNRIRRRIFEILRVEIPDDAPAHDLVVTIFSEKVTELPPEQLHNELTNLLAQANLIKSSKQAP